ncbi:hypothetical protein [Agrobacterium sp. NPDC090283]|uniref:hypothetical protein n=1 Tax=Agrobacterium sp. NPDC090283 TaxID=3363920 RepID=UPI00383AD530
MRKFFYHCTEMFWTLVLSAIQPTSLVSLFGPALLHVNLSLLRGNMALAGRSDPQLVASLSNPWTIAMSEWEVQFYTFILALFVCLAQAFQLWFAFHRSNPTRHRIKSVKNDFVVMAATLAIIATLGLGLAAGFFGIAAREEVIALYLPPSHDLRASEFALPSLYSPITWGRGMTFICGILVSLAARRHSVTILGVKDR